MTYRAAVAEKAAMAEKKVRVIAPQPFAAPPTRTERLKAGVVLIVLVSLAAAFWVAVIHFVATA